MYIAVVTQALVPLVGLSMFVLVLLSLTFPGILALHYHLNQMDELLCPTFYSDYFYQNRSHTNYVYRGGPSSDDAGCGSFSINAIYTFSVASWLRSAALSFKSAV